MEQIKECKVSVCRHVLMLPTTSILLRIRIFAEFYKRFFHVLYQQQKYTSSDVKFGVKADSSYAGRLVFSFVRVIKEKRKQNGAYGTVHGPHFHLLMGFYMKIVWARKPL